MPAKKGAAPNRMSEKDYDRKLKNKCKETGHKIVRVGSLTGVGSKTKHKCLKCSSVWLVKPANLLHCGSGCPKCRKHKELESFSSLKKRVEKVHSGVKVISRVVENSNARLNLECSVCSHTWYALTRNALSGASCPSCAGCLRYTRDSFIKRSQDKFGEGLDYSKVLIDISAHSTVTLTCSTHGTFKIKACNHLNSVHGCRGCSIEKVADKNTFTRKEFIEKSKELFGNLFTYENLVYTGVHSYLTLTCKIHGDFELLGYNHLHSGSGCLKCSDKESSPQKKLREALENKGLECTVNNRRIVKGHEIDVYLDKYKVGLEVNGIYWHSTLHKSKLYHYTKTLACKKNGVELLHFWDYEIRDKLPIVLGVIRSKLGKNKRVYARKCCVKRIEANEGRQFFEENHLQGADKSKVYLGLFNDSGMLVSVASFSAPRFSKEATWELVRFATKTGITVVGGASKLLSHFRKEFPGSIISYADLRHSQGNVYKALGFRFLHRTSPNYFWIKGSIKYSRYQTQKHRLNKILTNFSSTLSERENMTNNGFYQVYDCGNLVYMLD